MNISVSGSFSSTATMKVPVGLNFIAIMFSLKSRRHIFHLNWFIRSIRNIMGFWKAVVGSPIDDPGTNSVSEEYPATTINPEGSWISKVCRVVGK
jgi:hypothetical protein